jgi:aspartyl-tRNA(Asn)/glutamyl-tRNA(Gln) amidotransferase subunit B
MQWDVVIGLEIHAQLATNTKIFSGASTAYGAPPNTQACAVDLGLPGVLPVLNERAVEMAVKLGLALGSEIAGESVFARKNYFYPDLPKGYQISQYDQPIVQGGSLTLDTPDGNRKTIGITRAHLEEDAGKSLHEDFHGMSGIDLNRAGTPLLEIVSEPDMRSPEEAVAYMKKLHGLVQYLEICDGNMQEGSFRCDANISLRPDSQSPFGVRSEIKNLNSFRFLERALHFEIERHREILEAGGTITQETRLFDPDSGETRTMRTKEEAEDYRYFPEPDLLPVVVDQARIERVRDELPELPEAKRARFIEDYGLKAYDAGVLTGSRALADYFEAVVQASGGEAKLSANWVMGDFSAALKRDESGPSEAPVPPEGLGKLVQRIADKTISGSAAKQVFEALWAGQDTDPDALIDALGLRQITDSAALEALVDQVIADHPDQVAQYQAGKEKLLGFLVGKVMKASQGKAAPDQVNALLRARLNPDGG